MLGELKELWRFRELLYTLVERDLKIRYKNSVLGFLWSLLNPLVTVVVMTFVLGTFMYRDQESLSAYILAAYIPFTFFQLAILDSAQSVLASITLIKKVYFPREILPIVSVVANFIHLTLALVAFFAFLIVVWLVSGMKVFPIQWTTIFLPILLLLSFAFALGIGFIVSALNTFYEDVKYIVNAILYVMFFLCPIMYFSEAVANSDLNRRTDGLVYKLYQLNPIASLATAFRKLLVAPPAWVPVAGGERIPPSPLDWRYMAVTAVICIGTLIGGYALFNRLKWRFVERP